MRITKCHYSMEYFVITVLDTSLKLNLMKSILWKTKKENFLVNR